MRLKILLFLSLILSACSGSKTYLISVVDKSSLVAPLWLHKTGPGEYLGMGEDSSQARAQEIALTKVKLRIAEELGVKVSARQTETIIETDGVLRDSTILQQDIVLDVYLRDLNQYKKGAYWEHCRAQVSSKTYRDFYRYYLLFRVPPDFIAQLRQQTLSENARRQQQLAERLSAVDNYLSGQGGYVDAARALEELINAAAYAQNLLFQRDLEVWECTQSLTNLAGSLRLELVESYSEIRPERHSVTFRVAYWKDGEPLPAQGLKINFKLLRGNGTISPSAMTDSAGQVVCAVREMLSQMDDNILQASFDSRLWTDRISSIPIPQAEELALEFTRTLESLTLRESFSTLAKSAKVLAGPLMISAVQNEPYNTIFRHISDMTCRVSLTEIHGRDVKFQRMRIKATGWFASGIFGGTPEMRQVEGDYSLKNMELPYKQTRIVLLPEIPVITLINQLKVQGELKIQSVALDIELTGQDDAGNCITAVTRMEPVEWNVLLKL